MNKQTLSYELGYCRGMADGIREYAVWKDGQQLVGVMLRPLHEVLKPINAEAEKAVAKLAVENAKPTAESQLLDFIDQLEVGAMPEWPCGFCFMVRDMPGKFESANAAWAAAREWKMREGK